jgi:UDP:flavonoid glycosyltransferase YjiC (YdhE family)
VLATVRYFIHSAYRVEEAGVGLVLGDKFTFTSEAVRDKLNQLLNEEHFTKTAVKVSKIMRRLGGAKVLIRNGCVIYSSLGCPSDM